jgi:rhodanese-related sulfurtransferase
MPQTVTRRQLEGLVSDGAQLVEVLPEDEYTEEHLPGATSLPLRQLTREAAERLDRSRPVIVYCWDAL